MLRTRPAISLTSGDAAISCWFGSRTNLAGRRLRPFQGIRMERGYLEPAFQPWAGPVRAVQSKCRLLQLALHGISFPLQRGPHVLSWNRKYSATAHNKHVQNHRE